MFAVHYLPAKYLDVFHRSALHLGRWVKVEGRHAHVPYTASVYSLCCTFTLFDSALICWWCWRWCFQFSAVTPTSEPLWFVQLVLTDYVQSTYICVCVCWHLKMKFCNFHTHWKLEDSTFEFCVKITSTNDIFSVWHFVSIIVCSGWVSVVNFYWIFFTYFNIILCDLVLHPVFISVSTLWLDDRKGSWSVKTNQCPFSS